jgi:UDP-N-acetylmuramoylalanine-D-glutamate ligase
MGGSNARIGKSDFLLVESDESDGSFLKLAPIIAVVTNIDREHLDHYHSLDEILRSFLEFVNRVPFYGASILCLDDENVPSRSSTFLGFRSSKPSSVLLAPSSAAGLSSAEGPSVEPSPAAVCVSDALPSLAAAASAPSGDSSGASAAAVLPPHPIKHRAKLVTLSCQIRMG